MINQKVSGKLYGLTDTPMSAAGLVALHQGHLDYFNELHNRGIENERYRKGTNLSPSQEQDYYNQDRIPFPSAITADKLNRIISSERNSKTSAKAEATKPESEVKAELLTMRFKKVEQDSDLPYIESEIFESGVAVIYGVGQLGLITNKVGLSRLMPRNKSQLSPHRANS